MVPFLFPLLPPRFVLHLLIRSQEGGNPLMVLVHQSAEFLHRFVPRFLESRRPLLQDRIHFLQLLRGESQVGDQPVA